MDHNINVIIYQPTKTTMQSAPCINKKWLLEFKSENTDFIEPLMGWKGTKDMRHQLTMNFDSLDDAKNFANKQGYLYEIITPAQSKRRIRTYAENFTKE